MNASVPQAKKGMEGEIMSTRDRIAMFIKTSFYVPAGLDISDDTSLLDAGIIDSTGTLEVITFLETELGVRVEDHEISSENFDSVNRIAAFVARKTAARAPAAARSAST